NVRMTRKNAPIMKIGFSNGTFLKATPDHEILTNNGWKRIDGLHGGDLIHLASWTTPLLFHRKFKNSMESDTIRKNMDILRVIKEVLIYIEQYGNFIIKKIQEVFMFIIKIMTRAITEFQIYNSFLLQNIYQCIPRSE